MLEALLKFLRGSYALNLDERTYYHPVPRGLEIKIREKLAEIKKR